MSNKDITACQLLITQLKSNLPNEAPAWEQALVSLIKAIEHNYHHESLLAILQHLPLKIIEALYLRIASSAEIAPLCLKTLVDHINSLHADDSTHAVTLINLVLSSQSPIA